MSVQSLAGGFRVFAWLLGKGSGLALHPDPRPQVIVLPARTVVSCTPSAVALQSGLAASV